MMGEPCKQEAPVAQLIERTNNQQSVLIEMASALKVNNELLTQVAEVLSDVKHLHADNQRNERAISEMFNRVRALELAPKPDAPIKSLEKSVKALATKVEEIEQRPGQSATKAWWVIFGVLAGASGSVVSGVIVMLIRWGAGL